MRILIDNVQENFLFLKGQGFAGYDSGPWSIQNLGESRGRALGSIMPADRLYSATARQLFGNGGLNMILFLQQILKFH